MLPTPLNDEEINSQQILLATYRRTLAFLLTQRAAHGGEAYAPPVVLNGIYEARENIRRIKNTLRQSGIEVTDQADDESTPYGEPTATGESPFKGLLYFDEEDAHLFFGRESLTSRLVEQLRDQQFLAVVGASGSGKSSVVRAGLISALRRGEPLVDGSLPPTGSATWPIHVITPTAHPLEALAASLTRESESVSATATLIDDLARDGRSLNLAVRRLLSRTPVHGVARRLLLVIDQFEEIFTLCRDDAEQKAFVDNLINATSPTTDGPTVAVIVLRADFYQACGKFANLREALEKWQIYIGAMSTEERRRAIEEPARLGGWEFEPGLVDLLLRDAGDQPGTLPLLGHALLETWKRRQGRLLTLKGYTDAGGVRGAIAKTAESVFNQRLTPEQQGIARNIFLRLVELSDIFAFTRRRAMHDELILRAEDAQKVEVVLQMLADARLIITGDGTAEVAHEALIEEWPTLRTWLAEDHEALLLHHRLADATNAWLKQAGDPGELYRGMRLEQAEAWASTHHALMSMSEQAFLDASLAQREREKGQAVAVRRQRLLLRLVLAALALIVLVPAPALLAYRQVLRAQAAGELATLPGGKMIIGTDDPDRTPEERPREEIQIGTFQIEKTEVTNRQYALCLQARACQDAPTNRTFFDDPDFTEAPVVYVTAYQAAAYCNWLGRRLPTDAEWERAARGLNSAIWPWGDAPITAQRANIVGDDGQPRPLKPVGSFPGDMSLEGVKDLAGNALEWTSTVLIDCSIGYCRDNWNGVDNQGLVIRGGSSDSDLPRITWSSSAAAQASDQALGFRCVQP